MTAVRTTIGLAAAGFGLLSIAACGDVYADPDPAKDPTADAGIVVAADATTGPPPPPQGALTSCPQIRPRENSSCPRVGSACEYGTSADRECNTVVACEGQTTLSAWIPRPSDPCFAQRCPASADTAALDGLPCDVEADGGAPSDADEAVCNMTDGICACTTGRDGTTKHERRWVCVRPISVCPPNRPLLGSSCTGGLWCDYGSCAFKRGLVMECVDGIWLTGGATCE